MSELTDHEYQVQRAALVGKLERLRKRIVTATARVAAGGPWPYKTNRVYDREYTLQQAIRDLDRRWDTRNWTTQDWADYWLVANNID